MKKEIINANSNKSNKNKDKSFSRSSSYTKPIIKCIFENNEKILFDKETFLSIKPSLINNNYFKIQTLKNNSIQIDKIIFLMKKTIIKLNLKIILINIK